MQLNPFDKSILAAVADLHEIPQGAVNIRKDGGGFFRRSTENIEIVTKADKPGIDVIVKPGTVNESVHIPVIVTQAGLSDLVYNTFDIGADADVTIIAGCGIHNDGHQAARHDGIHEIIVRRGARMKYVEKHYGEGEGTGDRILNPTTLITVEEGGYLEMELTQIRGVDSTKRITEARLEKGAGLKMVEKLLTHGAQTADSSIVINLEGVDSYAQVLARSVGQDTSKQLFRARMVGKSQCTGHVECDSIIMDQALISAAPELTAESADAVLTHEAAIGRIAGDQLIKLMTLGLNEKEAVDRILSGFLK